MLDGVEAQPVETKLGNNPVKPLQQALLHVRVALVYINQVGGHSAVFSGKRVLLREEDNILNTEFNLNPTDTERAKSLRSFEASCTDEP